MKIANYTIKDNDKSHTANYYVDMLTFFQKGKECVTTNWILIDMHHKCTIYGADNLKVEIIDNKNFKLIRK